jgi:LytS/YehU family sensor histidine kinase
MAVTYDGRPLVTCVFSMLCGGLAGGLLYWWRPRLAQHPLTGFCLTATVSWLRDSLIFLSAPGAKMAVQIFAQIGIAPMIQGLGTALILAIVGLARDRDEQTRVCSSRSRTWPTMARINAAPKPCTAAISMSAIRCEAA